MRNCPVRRPRLSTCRRSTTSPRRRQLQRFRLNAISPKATGWSPTSLQFSATTMRVKIRSWTWRCCGMIASPAGSSRSPKRTVSHRHHRGSKRKFRMVRLAGLRRPPSGPALCPSGGLAQSRSGDRCLDTRAGDEPAARYSGKQIDAISPSDRQGHPDITVDASIFRGLSAFPLTPADADGAVDTGAFAVMIDRLVAAGVDSIAVLGSTGTYAYLDRSERARALACAVESIAGRVPLIAGIGAMRTSWVKELARDAERLGADGLLLAPVSYAPLTQDQVFTYFEATAAATGLLICIYNNPSTTHFGFSPELVSRLSRVTNTAAIKMPLPADGDFATEIGRLRSFCREGLMVGYSGDWGAAPALLAGADAWYSVVAGLFPVPALRLTRAALSGGRHRGKCRLRSALDPVSGSRQPAGYVLHRRSARAKVRAPAIASSAIGRVGALGRRRGDGSHCQIASVRRRYAPPMRAVGPSKVRHKPLLACCREADLQRRLSEGINSVVSAAGIVVRIGLTVRWSWRPRLCRARERDKARCGSPGRPRP